MSRFKIIGYICFWRIWHWNNYFNALDYAL